MSAQTPTPVGELYVIRHGQTEWSRVGRHTGLSDLDLTEVGVGEAGELREVFAGHRFAGIRVSPLLRAARTAQLAGLAPVTVDGDLVEWDYGGYEGLTTAQISEQLGRDWSVWTDGVVPGVAATPGGRPTPGESVEQVGARVDRVIEQVSADLAEGDVALVAHAHTLRILTARWLGLAPTAGSLFRLETATYGVLGFEHGRRVVRRWSVR